jgi:hypothetical protein
MNNLELSELSLKDGFIGLIQKETINRLYNNIFFIVKNVKIYPLEVEVYYFKEGEYEDNSVHQNERQQNNNNHFYIHRFGKGKNDKYKGHAGIDFVWSKENNLYYTWLLRSVIIKKNNQSDTFIGPMKVLQAIKDWTCLSFEDLETETLSFEYELNNNEKYPVFTSERIGLTDSVDKKYRIEILRFIIAKDYANCKYKQKSNPVINFYKKVYQVGAESKETCLSQCKLYLNYIPKKIKEM